MTTAQERAHLSARTPIDDGQVCDRCRMAAARARITTIQGSVLYLCGHHYGEHELALIADVTLTIHHEPLVCMCYQCLPVADRPKV